MVVNWSISERFFSKFSHYSFNCINRTVRYLVRSITLSFKLKENVLCDIIHNPHHYDIVIFNSYHI